MADSLLALLLVTESAAGSNIVCRWPPRPSSTPRLARPPPSQAFRTQLDNPWRAFCPDPAPVDGPVDCSAAGISGDDDEGYEWRTPYAKRDFDRDRSASFSRTPSRSMGPPGARGGPTTMDSGPSSPTTLEMSSMSLSVSMLDSQHAVSSESKEDRAYNEVFGYGSDFLSSILCPPTTMCHQRFDLVVDQLVFLGHPVSADRAGVWHFPEPAPSAFDTRGRERHNSSGQDEENADKEKEEKPAGWLQTFHFVVVLDLPDPSSSATGNIAKYFDVIYEQIAFTFSAVLFQEQISNNFVERECDALIALREDHVLHGKPFDEYISATLEASTLAASLKTLYESIKTSSIAYLTIDALPLELQLPPYLDNLLYPSLASDIACVEECEEDPDEEDNWGRELSFGWRLPQLAPWKALLLLDTDEDPMGIPPIPYLSLRGSHVHADDRALAEGLLRFLELAQITTSLSSLAEGLGWDLHSQVYPTVRWLVQHRRAILVDAVHPKLKTPFALPPTFPQPLSALSADFARAFGAHAGVPGLPALLAALSAGAHRPDETHFFAACVRARARIPRYTDVLRWLLARGVLVRLHLRIRVRAPPALKARVRAKREMTRARRAADGDAAPGPGPRRRSRRSTTGNMNQPSPLGMFRSGPPDEDGDGGVLDRPTAASPEELDAMLVVALSPRHARMHAQRTTPGASHEYTKYPAYRWPPGGEVEEEESDDDWDDDTLAEDGDDERESIISDPSRATPLERRWMHAMSEGKDSRLKARFEQISQYFDGRKADDEILYRANISRKQLREVLIAYDEYLEPFLHS